MTTGFRGTLVRFGIFAAVALALLGLLYNTMRNGVGGGTTGYSAVFSNVSGLSTGDDVRVAGVRVGKVTDIAIVPQGAKVDFELAKDQPILANTSLVMRYQNLLGQRYLSMVQPAQRGRALPAGATVPVTRTSPGFDLTELLNGFRPLLDTLRPADVNALAESVVKVLQGEGGTVAGLLKQTGELTSYVADRDQVIGQVLTNLTPVLRDLAGQGDELRSSARELRALMTGLARDRQSIGNSITGLSTLINDTSDLVGELRSPATVDVHLARQVAAALDQQRMLLTKALGSFGIAFGALGRGSSYINGVNVYLCTLWLTTDLGEVNLSTRAQGGPWTEACR